MRNTRNKFFLATALRNMRLSDSPWSLQHIFNSEIFEISFRIKIVYQINSDL